MLDYELYYWELPFRGHFIQLFLEEVRANYRMLDAGELYPDRNLDVHYPGMAPPYLYDCKAKAFFSQMPAILMHLGHAHDYLPGEAEKQTLALKVILDCNDILMEITNHNGLVMWDSERWEEFRAKRLADWMRLFEKTGQEHRLEVDQGHILGPKITVADIATTALFGQMVHSFPPLAKDLRETAPLIASLCQRIESRDSIRPFLEKQRRDRGEAYCGGQIEDSLRKVIR